MKELEGVVTIVIPAEALRMVVGEHVRQLTRLIEVSSCVVCSKGPDDHITRKDRHSEFDSRGILEDAEYLSIVLANVHVDAKQLPKEGD